VGGDDQIPFERDWQKNNLCGPIALYGLLNMCDKDVDYEGLVQSLSPPEEGSSLLELRDAAASRGLNLMILKGDKHAFNQFSPPFMIHCTRAQYNHYYVVNSTDANHVYFWNPDNGQSFEVTREDFFRMWTGYCLVPRKPSHSVPEVILICSVLVLGVFLTHRSIYARQRQEWNSISHSNQA
jgi:ABC-type bacteriocin/lantibiotic exporter with double-glycine peptidase domain